ncbi:MAG TPA: carbon monoxide dehydrogenase subunit G [Candidatus Dormibacteraeota bacterium]|nr:carbon monoxide dehydrogenase subunit G [Candidatus Dormibacteraeota bacterium]
MKIEMNGVERVSVTPAQALAFVSDPKRVGTCMPDLENLQVSDERHFVATVRVGVGPVKGRLKMEVELTSDPSKPEELQMAAKGSGMGSGMNLNSRVRVTSAGDGASELHWTADAAVSGPLASVGGRLLEAQAKKTTERMFAAIREALGSSSP